MIIKPTIGRKVWYFDAPGTREQDATVIDVHNDRCVSLFVISRTGHTFTRLFITLVQEEDAIPNAESYCTWMPYQTGQAKKHEAEKAA